MIQCNHFIISTCHAVADRAIISFTRKTLNLYEGNEDMDEQLFIKIDGEIEPTVPIRLILYLLNGIYYNYCNFVIHFEREISPYRCRHTDS